jgi:hypothetical protein
MPGSIRLQYTDGPKLTISQGDLGHTDLQEDLEFHSSSTSHPASFSHNYCPLTHPPYRLRHAALPRSPQNPARQPIFPPRSQHLSRLQQPQTLPLDPILLRASLRRRHQRSPAPLHICHLPARQFPRRPRRKSRSLWPCVDRDDCRCHPVPYGNY